MMKLMHFLKDWTKTDTKNMEEQIPPMSPEDLKYLVDFAGPVFGETRQIEKMIDTTNVGSHNWGASGIIKQAIAQAEQQVRQQLPVHVPHIPIPQVPFIPEQLPLQNDMFSSSGYVQNVPAASSPGVSLYERHEHNVPPPNDQQLEFSFDPNKQDITNNHLRDISNTLKKILKYYEDESKAKKNKEVIKLTSGKFAQIKQEGI